MRKKIKRKQSNPRVTMTYLVLMLVFIAEMLFYAWCRTQYVNVKYEIQKQAKQMGQLAAMQDHLKIELRRLRSPRRISKIAREELGLVTPTPQQTIILPQK